MKVLLILVSLILTGCGAGKQVQQSEIQEIQFGRGGGVTGAVKAYTLTADSRLLEKGKELRRIRTIRTLELFKRAGELKDYLLAKPGNLYSFITIKSNKKENRIVWAAESTEVDQAIVQFHKELMALVK
jgi:hypothetical protein